MIQHIDDPLLTSHLSTERITKITNFVIKHMFVLTYNSDV
jgi:hypothetical protein